eukprot:m.234583 g.234583  ORF g.234583 m.234583 type:complete len:370 (-) comp10885_c0_seq5:129-1238(-)
MLCCFCSTLEAEISSAFCHNYCTFPDSSIVRHVQALVKYFPNGSYGATRDHQPIWYECIGGADPKGLMHAANKDDLVRFQIWNALHIGKILNELSIKHNKIITTVTVLIDVSGLSWDFLYRPFVSAYTTTLDVFEANFPETLASLYIINPPAVFPMLFAMVKPFLHENTRNKFTILSGAPNTAASKLADIIDPAVLPKRFGGEIDDPPGVSFGGKVPEELLLQADDLDQAEGAVSHTIPRGTLHHVCYDIEQAGAILTWSFKTKGHDVGFGLYRVPAGKESMLADGSKIKEDELEAHRRLERVESHRIPISGQLRVDEPGKYVVLFDNRFSWTRSKAITYVVNVLDVPEPEPEPEDDELSSPGRRTAQL